MGKKRESVIAFRWPSTFSIQPAPVEEKESAGEEEEEGEGSALLELTDETFEPYINDHRGIHFVKFYAPW